MREGGRICGTLRYIRSKVFSEQANITQYALLYIYMTTRKLSVKEVLCCEM